MNKLLILLFILLFSGCVKDYKDILLLQSMKLNALTIEDIKLKDWTETNDKSIEELTIEIKELHRQINWLSKNPTHWKMPITSEEMIELREKEIKNKEQFKFLFRELSKNMCKIKGIDTTGYIRWDFKFLDNLKELPKHFYHMEGKDLYWVPISKIQKLLNQKEISQ